ncbi:hypothetical protein [Flavimaricola marinus]|nr:hypothetical protein [Flavimaricola marinus]
MTAASDAAQRIGTIVHLGAGTGEALDNYLDSGAAQIVLVEPEPERAEDLRALVASLSARDQARVQVIERAVAMQDGTAMLTVFNQTDASSLVPPTGLSELYPGLRVLSRTEVETVSPASLLKTLTLDPDALNWLIVETPGLEAQVLRALADLGGLTQFVRLDLRCGAEPLYEGAASGQEILTWLAEEGYLLGPSPEEADPDLCERRLMRNPSLPKIRAVEAECADLKARLGELEAALDVQTQERAAERQSTEAAAASQAEQLHSLTAALEEKSKALETSEQARKTRVEQVEHLNAEKAALTEKLSQSEAAAASQAEQVQSLTAALEEKSKALETSEQARKTRVEQVEHLNAEKAALTERLSQSEAAAASQAERVQSLTAALEEKSKALESSEQARKTRVEQVENLNSEKAALTEKLSKSEAAAASQAEQVRSLTAEKTALSAQVDDLTKKLAEASLVTKADLAAAHAERDRLRKELEDTKAALQTSQTQRAQLAQSRDDIVRAEGQIALIKDLLLSGPEL